MPFIEITLGLAEEYLDSYHQRQSEMIKTIEKIRKRFI